MKDTSKLSISYEGWEGSGRGVSETIDVCDDQFASFVETFACFVRSTPLQNDPRFVQMVDFWEMLQEEPFSWDECGDDAYTESELLDICEELNSNKDDGPDVCDPVVFRVGDIVKVTHGDYMDSIKVIDKIGKVDHIDRRVAHPTGQTVHVKFAEGPIENWWLDPRALTLIYRG